MPPDRVVVTVAGEIKLVCTIVWMQWASPQLSENRPTDRQEPCPITTTTTAMTNLILTDEQIAHFDTQGYLILPCQSHNLVSPPLLQKWTNEVRNLPREHGKWMPYVSVNGRTHRLLEPCQLNLIPAAPH